MTPTEQREAGTFGRGSTLIGATILIWTMALVACNGELRTADEGLAGGGSEGSGGIGDDGSGSLPGGDEDGTSPSDAPFVTDGEDPFVGEDGRVYFDECAAVAEAAHNVVQPADVIIAVDNTPSMFNEIQEVRENLHRFSEMVEAQGLDMRIVLISCRSGECLVHRECDTPPCWHTICIPPPLGAPGGCEEGADDTNLPDFLHVDAVMPSLKSLERIIWAYEDFAGALRTHAVRHVVVVSDDNDYWSADQFEQELAELDPSFEGYLFHGIYSFMNKYEACEVSRDDPCCIYAAPDGAGTVYRELVERTGGVAGNMCEQDFDPIFDRLADAVVESVGLSCEWRVPEPPEDMSLDSSLVNVQFMAPDGTPHLIGRLESAEECETVLHGWYFDDPDDPTSIMVCPQTCDWIQDWEGSAMKLLFGCESIPQTVS